jgi:hypothetical protein
MAGTGSAALCIRSAGNSNEWGMSAKEDETLSPGADDDNVGETTSPSLDDPSLTMSHGEEVDLNHANLSLETGTVTVDAIDGYEVHTYYADPYHSC